MIEANYLLKIFNASPLPSLLLSSDDPHFTVIQVNKAYLLATNTVESDLQGKGIFDAFPDNPKDKDDNGSSILLESLRSVLGTGETSAIYNIRYDQLNTLTSTFEIKYWNAQNIAVLNNDNEVEYILHTIENVTENRYYLELERLEKDTLEMNAKRDKSIQEVVSTFMLGIERLHPGMICSMLERKGNHLFNLASPSLPKEFLEKINGIEVCDNIGACGTAAFLKKTVIASDIANDFRWARVRETALRHQLKACCSNPILDSAGNVIATFAAYFKETKAPARLEENIIQRAGYILQIIFERSLKEDAIKASDDKFRLLVRDMPVGVLLQGPNAEIILSNPKALEFLGIDEDQLVGKTSFAPDWNIIHEDGSPFPGSAHPVPVAIATGKPVREVVMGVYRPAIGDRIWLLVDAEPQLNEDGTVNQVVCSFINITKRKKAEKHLVEHDAKMSAILESTAAPVFSVDKEYKYTSFNMAHAAGMKSIYGVDIEIGESILDYQTVTADREKARQNFDRALQGEQFVIADYAGDTDLKRLYFEITHNPIFTPGGEVIGVSVFVNDLTNRKQHEDALRTSEERYRSIMLASPDQIAITDLEGKNLMVSPSAVEKLGYKDESELLGRNITDFIIPEDRERAGSKLALMFQGILTGPSEYRGLRQDGTSFDIEANAEFIRDAKGLPMQIVFIIRDISERKKADAELVKQKEFFEQMFMQSSISTLILDKDGWCERINPEFTKLFGVQPEQIEGRIYNIFKDKAVEAAGISAHFKSVFSKGETVEQELLYDIGLAAASQNITAEKKEKAWFHIRIFPIFDSNEKISHVIVQHADVTERKNAEAARLESEQRYRALVEWSPMPIGVHQKGKLIYVNPAATRMFKANSAEDLLGKPLIELSHPDSHHLMQKRLEVFAKNNPKQLPLVEQKFLSLDGLNSIDVEVQSIPIVYNGEEAYQVVVHDITERKKMEVALGESEQRYRSLVESSPDAIGVYRDGKMIYVNLAGIKMFGAANLADMVGKPIADFIHPDFHQLSMERIKALTETNEALPMVEMKFLRMDRSAIEVEVQSAVIFYDGSPAVQVTVRDISQRKKEEQHLKLLESVITNSNDAVLITEAEPLDEPDGPKIIYVNEAFTRMTGYTAAEVTGKTPRILQGAKTERSELIRLRNALQNWEPCEISQINYKKNGDEFWVHLSISPVADATGYFTHWISIQRDITEEKYAEAQNLLSAEISKLFNEQAPLAETLGILLEKLASFENMDLAEAWLIDSSGKRINLVATAPLNKKLQTFYLECAHINSFEKGVGLPGIAWQTGLIQNWQNIHENPLFTRRDAAKKVGLKTASALPIIYNQELIGAIVMGSIDNARLPERFFTTFKNLGPHIGAEIKRKQLEKELFQIFNFAPDIICISDFDGYFKKVNPATCELLEYSEEELKAVPYTEFIHPDDREKAGIEIKSLSKVLSSYYFESRYITKSGKIKWLAWTASPSTEDGLIFSVAKDVTEKKALEDLLSKVNTLARIGGWELDLLKQRLYWSSITKQIHEVAEDFEPALDTAINFYKPGHYREMISRSVEEGIASGKEWDLELKIITANGNERWVRSMGEAEFLNGKCIRVYGSFQDIDERKKAETALQQNIKALEDYKLALDESAIISITDEKGIILTANENFCRISRYTYEELIGQSHRIVNANFHSNIFFKDLWQTISSGKIWRGEIKNKTKDGTFYWVYATIIPFLDANKKPFQYLAIRFDITEKKNAEEKIRISNERYDLVSKATNDAIWDWNLETNEVIRAGEGLKTLFGYNSVEADKDNQFWRQRIHPDDLARMVAKLKATTDDLNASYWEDEYRFRKANGQYATVYEKGYIIRNELGKAIRIIGASQDITRLKENEIRLNELNEDLRLKAKELADSNAELEQFAYVASHDLQEPLRMVTGFLSQIERKYSPIIDETGKKYIDFAVDGAKRMRQIILDLLEFSRIGRNTGDMEELDLNLLVKDISLLFQKQIEEKGAVIEVDNLPVLHVYKAPLRQVFQNLIGNALKYSKKNGQVNIHIKAKELNDHWQFSVGDNGIGISKEYFDKIFIIFQRLHNKDEFSGTGIGLAVTKKVIENHGGKIWVESTEGEGSVFYFTIKKTIWTAGFSKSIE